MGDAASPCEVVKAATHVYACVGGTVDQFERGRRFAGELQDHEASPVADFDPAQLDVAQCGVETERAVQVGDAVGDEERLHAASPGRRTR